MDVVISMYNLIKYSYNYSKLSGSLWQYCKDIPTVDNNNLWKKITTFFKLRFSIIL